MTDDVKLNGLFEKGWRRWPSQPKTLEKYNSGNYTDYIKGWFMKGEDENGNKMSASRCYMHWEKKILEGMILY